MPVPSDIAVGAPVWLDLQSSDIAGSIEFYPGVFCWTHEQAADEYNGYVNFSKKGRRYHCERRARLLH